MKNPCKSHLRGFFYCQKITIFIIEVDFRLIQVIYSFFFILPQFLLVYPQLNVGGFLYFHIVLFGLYL